MYIYVCIHINYKYKDIYVAGLPEIPALTSTKILQLIDQVYVYLSIYIHTYLYLYLYLCIHVYMYIHIYIYEAGLQEIPALTSTNILQLIDQVYAHISLSLSLYMYMHVYE